MHFEFYHDGLDGVPKLSVDGTVGNSIHFSHWEGNETPAELKADTSTEIALNLVASPRRNELTRGIELVTNNHFDTDGVLSVWTVLNGERALELRDELISAAEAGDFSEFTNERAVRASIAIQGSDQPAPGEESASPLACQLAGERVDDDARAYELVLPEVERLLTKTDEYSLLWGAAFNKITQAMDSFASGASRVTEIGDISLVTLAPEVFGSSGFNPTRHAAPYTAISHYAKGQLFVIATLLQNNRWAYRIDYPYYSWAETIVRPRIPRRDFSQLLIDINQLEPNGEGAWKSDSGEMTSAIKFLGADGKLAASKLAPDDVVNILSSNFSSRQQGVAGV